ncbi:hypothetical protein [uncultured Ruthenibacterium sp.]|uniref:hypothetical protein n=1 Tax=uncultured Ruthenibacterium sp. TaxID=1905347 RepID=UPI00349ECC10
MASARYTLNITPDEPDEPQKPMTPKQKWENFWFYHKWHLLVGALVLFLVGTLVWEVVTNVEADYTIGVLTSKSLPYNAEITLSEKIAELCDDRNGDGTVEVQVIEYWISDDPVDANTQMAMVTKFIGDIQTGESMLFLTDDVDKFQKQYGIFAYNDGTSPEDYETADTEGMGVLWSECPALTALDLGNTEELDGSEGVPLQDVMKDYTLVKRVYTDSVLEGDEELTAYYNSAVSLFDAWTQKEA